MNVILRNSLLNFESLIYPHIDDDVIVMRRVINRRFFV